ncbi:MAG TPA: amino acid adenylation domain-containing protein [Ktedonobacteraceae bacterium]|nr:amino acid adenylation domain-containing protein [Ktedonobacteraceae bacterium]
MQDTTALSEAKRLLLEKLLRGGISQKPQPIAAKPHTTQKNMAPLSFGQQQLWLLALLMQDTPVYTECVTIHLPGTLDVPTFERSFNEIIRRHEAWRTSFPQVNGQPVQMVHAYTPLQVPVVDLRSLAVNEREAEAVCMATNAIAQPFDLANGPLLRTLLVQLSDTEHRLYLTLHHIIFDGYSLYQIFLPELRTIYDALLRGEPSPLPELPVQYPDFALWQREWAQGDTMAEQLAYWREQLAYAPAQLALPTDHQRPAVPTYKGSMHPFALSQSLTDALKTLSKREGVTLYMLLVATFQILLFRYSGQDNILIGTAISDRKRKEVQNLMGFFLNTLVLRTNLSGNPTVRELLQRVREVVLEAHAHQDVPFELLVKELQPERTAGQNPFFQALLSLEPPLHVDESGWTLSQMDVETNTAKFDLSLELDDRPDGLIGRFEYNTDLFDPPTIERMAGHWQTLLASIVAHPEQHIAELPLLTEAERQQILVSWNETTATANTADSANFIKDACLHQLFEAQVERTPDALAIRSGNQRLTYQALNEKANQVAHYLHKLGVAPEVLVGICMERSLEMVIAMLGVLKAGGAYVPLDPAYPQERIAFMLHDSQAKVLLTQQKLLATLPEQKASTVRLDSNWAVIAKEPATNPTSTATLANLAYVIYTSDSTGKPKGVAIEHHNVATFVQWALSAFTPEDLAGVLASTSICFDLSVFELFVTLSGGGCAIIVENILHLPEIPSSVNITLLNTVPSALHELLHGYRLPASVRTVNLAGEALSRSLVERVYEQKTVQRVFNLYGPSEDTTYSTYTLVEREASVITIGHPIANTQVYILDTHLQPVPVGITAELYISGDGLARGYLHRPKLTDERFIANPFRQQLNSRMYKTGDMARYLPDGSIEFLGRIDHQVKIRGFRVELGEIVETIKHFAGVRETVVVAREEAAGNKRIVAYVVAQDEQPFSVQSLRTYLQGKLPGYMIPTTFVLLAAIPLTPNGKIDSKALPAPTYTANGSKTATDASFVVPLMTIHHQLIKIWEELLNVHPIGIQDNFFDLGGHSLLAARLLSEIEHISGKRLPLATFFAGTTIEHLATAILGDEETRSLAPAVAIRANGTKAPFFFLHGDWVGGGFYCLELARKLDTDQPFYVLEPYKLVGSPVPPSLQAMAAAHIESMRAVQPEGPYHFGGFCNGGLIAYEMARQLDAVGQTVNLLLLVDPAIPEAQKAIRKQITRFGTMLNIGTEQQVDWFLRYIYMRIPYFRRKFKGAKHLDEIEEIALERKGNTPRTLVQMLNLIPPEANVLRQQWVGLYRWAAARYSIGPYTGKVTFLWSSDGRGAYPYYANVATNIEQQFLPGKHMEWKTKNLSILAEHMRIYLRNAHRLAANSISKENVPAS